MIETSEVSKKNGNLGGLLSYQDTHGGLPLQSDSGCMKKTNNRP